MDLLFKILVFLTVISGSSVLSQNVTTNNATNVTDNFHEILEKSIVKLRFHLREEHLKDLLIDIIYNTTGEGEEGTVVKTSDVVQLLGLDRITWDEFSQLTAALNRTMTNVPWAINWLRDLLKFTETPFKEFYDILLEDLGINRLNNLQVGQILTSVGIDLGQFSSALEFGTPDIFTVLMDGNYSDANINQALNISGKSAEQVFSAVRDIVVKKIDAFTLEAFINRLNEFNLDRRTFVFLWSFLNISQADVYEVETFRNILNSIVSHLNTNDSVAVITAGQRVVLHHAIYQRFRFVDFKFVKIQTNSDLELDSYSFRNLTENVVEARLQYESPYSIEIAKKFVPNCTYVTFNNASLVTEEVTIQSNETSQPIVVQKNNNTLFSLGSPLICNRKLYALASRENETNIEFVPLLTQNLTMHDDHQHSTHNQTTPSTASINLTTHCFLQLVWAGLILLVIKN